MLRQDQAIEYLQEKSLNATMTIDLYRGGEKEMKSFWSADALAESKVKPIAWVHYSMPISVGPHLVAEGAYSQSQQVVDCRYYRAISAAYFNIDESIRKDREPAEAQSRIRDVKKHLPGPKVMDLAIVGARLAFELYAEKNYNIRKIHVPFNTTTKDNHSKFDIGYQFLVEEIGQETNATTVSAVIKDRKEMQNIMSLFKDGEKELTGMRLKNDTLVFISDEEAIVITAKLGQIFTSDDMAKLAL